MAIARPEGDFGAPDLVGTDELLRDWHSLEACAREATALLGRWPSRLDRRLQWIPVGVPGGVEDVPRTEMEAQLRGYLSTEGPLSVTQSARWTGYEPRLRSTSVSVSASAVVEIVGQTLRREEWPLARSLVSPIAAVAQLAATSTSSRDPDPSSSPPQFVRFVASCMQAIGDLRSESRGEGVVPLLDTDELYEAWVALQAREALDSELGPQVPCESGALAAWRRDDVVFELWVKPGINAWGRTFGRTKFASVVADILIPDIVLAAFRDDESALFVLDAKSWTSMGPEDALTQAAKYMYGIRRCAEWDLVPAISGVDLVTCAVPPVASRGDIARVHVVGATPTGGVDELRSRIAATVPLLAAEVESRIRAKAAL